MISDSNCKIYQMLIVLARLHQLKFAELSELIQVLIDEQRYSHTEIRSHINELKRQISGSDSEYENPN